MTLEQLEAQRAAMPDRLDVPLQQLNDNEAKRGTLLTRIHTIRAAEATLAQLNPQIATLTKWRDHLVSWRKTLCEQLLACPPQARLGLELSIKRIDRGLDLMCELLPRNLPLDDLMREAGYVPRDAVARAHGEAWLGTLPYVAQRLAELQRRLDDAQARLNADVREQEQRTQLEEELASMLDPLDVPRSWTGSELNNYEARRAVLTSRITVIRKCKATLTQVDPQIATLTTYRNALVSVHSTLRGEYDALAKPRTSEEFGRQHNLRLSLLCLDSGLSACEGTGYAYETLRLGALMREAGVAWQCSLTDVELKLKALQEQRDDAKARLADTLMSDADREQKAKEDKARRELPQRKTRADGTQYDKYPDGRRVEATPDAVSAP